MLVFFQNSYVFHASHDKSYTPRLDVGIELGIGESVLHVFNTACLDALAFDLGI
jgi:hypothetical protein